MSKSEKLQVVSFSADPDDTGVIKRYAEDYERSFSEIVRLAIKLGLKEIEKSPLGELLHSSDDDQKTVLGRFSVTGDPAQLERCAGACGRVLPFRSFPTPRGGTASGLRVDECRECRDQRLGRK